MSPAALVLCSRLRERTVWGAGAASIYAVARAKKIIAWRLSIANVPLSLNSKVIAIAGNTAVVSSGIVTLWRKILFHIKKSFYGKGGFHKKKSLYGKGD